MNKRVLALSSLLLAVGCESLRDKNDELSGDAAQAHEGDSAAPVTAAGSDAGAASNGGTGGSPQDAGPPRDAAPPGDAAVGTHLGVGDASAAGSPTFPVKNIPAAMALGAPGDLIFNTSGCNNTPEIDTVTGELRGCNIERGQLKFSFVEIDQPDTSLGTLSATLIVTRRFVVEQGMRVNVVGNRPLIVVALQEALINGVLQAAATGADAHGGGSAVAEGGQSGLGPGGGGKPNGRSGAGGAGFCGHGGASGMADGLSALGGQPYGNATNVPLIGGSSGGVYSNWGGAGGGAIQISAGQRIDVGLLGSIHVGGGGPINPSNGGGSGGAILLEAPSVRVLGHLAANGGGGSAGTSNDGEAGANATADALPALGGRVSGYPSGGDGSAAATLDGAAGGDVPADRNLASGGGGGGAGRIRINVAQGAPDLTGAMLSPSQGTACFSIGTLQ
jgi:hypothetical protein